MFRVFGIWRSKTKVCFRRRFAEYTMINSVQSLPAIQFYASHAKSKCWKFWRAGMPQALRARKAQEMYKRHLLCKSPLVQLYILTNYHIPAQVFEKWLQVHRTKIALKAVA